MEVDADSFTHHLLGLLVNISEADFVSFDLEFSGIPSRLPTKSPRGSGRLTLQERYAETKVGADRYQILQTLASKVALVHSCLKHGFDLGAPFTSGVQYLSREEARRARQLAWDRIDKKNPIQDLQLKDDDVDSLDFVRRVRKATAKWKHSHSSYIDITTRTGFAETPSAPAISRFEKRLVHQLIRAEFPDLVSIGRADSVRIMNFDPVREADNARRIKKRIKEQIVRQTGFRWVFEALAQDGDINITDLLLFLQSNTCVDLSEDTFDVKDRCNRALERLKKKKPVLVGHNMFTDIVYLYRSFVGELPDTLDGFNDAIHELFPKIVDTKYLATHTEGDLNASPNLQEITESLKKQPLPMIEIHEDHDKYDDREAFHEAGYDSLLTATIMLQLGARLGAERTKQFPVQHGKSQSNENNLTPSKPTFMTMDDLRNKVRATADPPISRPLSGQFQKSTMTTESVGAPTWTVKNKNRNRKGKSNDITTQRFHTKNVFDTLRELRVDSETETEPEMAKEESIRNSKGRPSSKGAETPTKKASAASGSWENDVFVQDTTGWKPIEQVQRKPMELMPPFDSPFWHKFGNKLRVFGTQEAMLKLADWK